MNWYTIFYLFSVASGLLTFAGWLAGLGTISIIICFMLYFFSLDGNNFRDKTEQIAYKKIWRNWLWRAIIGATIGWAMIIFIPSKKDMLMIIAGGTVGNFLTSDTSAKKIPSDITQYLHKAIQSEIKDLDLPIEAKKAFGTSTPKDEFIDKIKSLSKEEIIERLKTDSTLK